MRRRIVSLTLCAGVLTVVTGCSDEGEGAHGQVSATSQVTASEASDAASSQPAGPSSSVAGEGTYAASDAHVGVVVDDITQIFPQALAWRSGELRVQGDPDAQGQFSAVRPGLRLTADQLTKPARIAWLDDKGVIGMTQWPVCSGSCAVQRAPRGARYVVVQAEAAGRYKVLDGASIKVQLTKVNVPANLRTGRATSTQVPRP